MKKVVKGYWQNVVNHIASTIFGLVSWLGAGIYFWQNISTFKNDLALNTGVISFLVLLGFIALGMKDRINLFQKTYNK